jgi:hypothetical protein
MVAIHKAIEKFENVSLEPKCFIKMHLKQIHLIYWNYWNEIIDKNILKTGQFDEGLNCIQHRQKQASPSIT